MVGSRNRGPAPWAVGDIVQVVYEPGNPERADLRTELEGWRFWFVMWCAIALVPASVAMLPLLLLARTRGRAAEPDREA